MPLISTSASATVVAVHAARSIVWSWLSDGCEFHLRPARGVSAGELRWRIANATPHFSMPPAATTDFGSDNTRLAPIPSTFVLLFARLAARGETQRLSIKSISASRE